MFFDWGDALPDLVWFQYTLAFQVKRLYTLQSEIIRPSSWQLKNQPSDV